MEDWTPCARCESKAVQPYRESAGYIALQITFIGGAFLLLAVIFLAVAIRDEFTLAQAGSTGMLVALLVIMVWTNRHFENEWRCSRCGDRWRTDGA